MQQLLASGFSLARNDPGGEEKEERYRPGAHRNVSSLCRARSPARLLLCCALPTHSKKSERGKRETGEQRWICSPDDVALSSSRSALFGRAPDFRRSKLAPRSGRGLLASGQVNFSLKKRERNFSSCASFLCSCLRAARPTG